MYRSEVKGILISWEIYQKRDETGVFVKTRSPTQVLVYNSLYYLAGSRTPYIHVILSLCSVHYKILTQPLVRLTTAHYQSAVSMISFAQVLTAQWSDTIPCPNVWFQVRITSHDILFQQKHHCLPPYTWSRMKEQHYWNQDFIPTNAQDTHLCHDQY